MIDRSFSEVDLREMLEAATSYRPDRAPGRWIIETSHAQKPWNVVVEPDAALVRLIVVTAFPIG